MGPLIPQGIIDPAWNNVFALLIGLAFGFILESSGFSSSRKLAGVFYGYDFVVLKVFMTAVMVCMIGLLYFDYMGWMKLSSIYILPTFLYSVIIGGVIMGFGFILGGYCPGTSFCGAVIGKIDAMFFTVGLYLGILFFSVLYPVFEKIYHAANMGPVQVHDLIGIPAAWFAFAFLVVGLIAFFVVSKIEARAKKIEY